MKYSVLMAVYNREKPEFLTASIRSMLNQTIAPDDFVIVADGPLGEELEQVLSRFQKEKGKLFQIIRMKENKGLGKALQRGMKACKNEWIARMDSDDIACPERVEKQLALILAKRLDIVSGTIEEFELQPGDRKVLRRLPNEEKEIRRFLRRRNPFNHPCVMYRKSAVIKAGGYRHFYRLEDYYLWIRMIQNGCRCGNVSDVVLYMRTGNGMYQRRGGKSYLYSVSKLHWYMKKKGLCSLWDYIVTMAGMIVMLCMPEGIKKGFYRRCLRQG